MCVSALGVCVLVVGGGEVWARAVSPGKDLALGNVTTIPETQRQRGGTEEV